MFPGGVFVNFREISIGEKITDSLSKRESKGYLVRVEANRKLTIDLRGPANQDFDLYIKHNEEASTLKWDYKRVTTKADEIITIDGWFNTRKDGQCHFSSISIHTKGVIHTNQLNGVNTGIIIDVCWFKLITGFTITKNP